MHTSSLYIPLVLDAGEALQALRKSCLPTLEASARSCGCPLSGLDHANLVAHLALLQEESEEEETSEEEVEMQEVCMRPDCISCIACFDDCLKHETF